jgi:hypothetical protein
MLIFCIQRVTVLTNQPVCVLFKPDRTNGLHLPGLDETVVPIQPFKSRGFSIIVHGSTSTIVRHQFPLLPAFAFTIEKCQGQNIPFSVIDIADIPGRGSRLSLSHLYVAFSRSSGRQTVRIMRPFSTNTERIMTTHVGGDKREDDDLLRRQHNTTKARWMNDSLLSLLQE